MFCCWILIIWLCGCHWDLPYLSRRSPLLLWLLLVVSWCLDICMVRDCIIGKSSVSRFWFYCALGHFKSRFVVVETIPLVLILEIDGRRLIVLMILNFWWLLDLFRSTCHHGLRRCEFEWLRLIWRHVDLCEGLVSIEWLDYWLFLCLISPLIQSLVVNRRTPAFLHLIVLIHHLRYFQIFSILCINPISIDLLLLSDSLTGKTPILIFLLQLWILYKVGFRGQLPLFVYDILILLGYDILL